VPPYYIIMKPRFAVWLEDGSRYIIGEKEARILEGLEKYGSLMATAKSLGVTYAHVWKVVERLTNCLGKPVVSAYRGGEAGGGTTLTEDGLALLREYQKLEDRIAKFIGSSNKRVFVDYNRPGLVIIGSSCPALKLLIGLIKGTDCEVVEVGSSAGITAVMLGEADIAGIHLYDPVSGKYNEKAVKDAWPHGMAALIKGYVREQGLLVKSGNPKGIWCLEDLQKKNGRLVNRNLGSGTRELLDRLIKSKGMDAGSIRGYDFEVKTHEEVAKAIVENRADAGIGLRAMARAHNLDFAKLCEEEYDFVAERRRINKPEIKAFIASLKSADFREMLGEKYEGIWTTGETGKVLEITG